MLNYYLIDTETTHLSEKIGEIVQISVIRCSDRVQLSRDIKAEFPDRASPEALRVTNKTKQDILKGADKVDIVKLVDDFINEDGLTPKHRVCVGHNCLRFDKKWLHVLWEKVGKKFPIENWLDTMDMMKEYRKKYNLGNVKINLKDSMALLKVAGIQRFHAAGVDAQNNFLLWQKLMDDNLDYLSLIKRHPHEDKDDFVPFPEF